MKQFMKTQRLFVVFGTAICLLASCGKSVKEQDRMVYLQNSNLSSIPDSIFDKPHLEVLVLSNHGFIAPIGNSAFENGNSIFGVSEKICTLKELKVLDLAFNQLSVLPSCIDELQNLTELDLSGNPNFDVHWLVPHILKLKKLKLLNLFGVRQAMAERAWLIEQLECIPLDIIITREELLKKYSTIPLEKN